MFVLSAFHRISIRFSCIFFLSFTAISCSYKANTSEHTKPDIDHIDTTKQTKMTYSKPDTGIIQFSTEEMDSLMDPIEPTSHPIKLGILKDTIGNQITVYTHFLTVDGAISKM